MRRLQLGTALLAGLSLSWTTGAFQNYTQADMMRAQLSLMDGRSDDCPPWYVPNAFLSLDIGGGV